MTPTTDPRAPGPMAGEGPMDAIDSEALATMEESAIGHINSMIVYHEGEAERARGDEKRRHHTARVEHYRALRARIPALAEANNWTRADLRREIGEARALAEPAHKHRWRCSCGDEVLEGEKG